MNLTVYELDGGQVVTEFHNDKAWFAEIKLANGKLIQVRVNKGDLELSSTNGALVIKPQAANSLAINAENF